MAANVTGALLFNSRGGRVVENEFVRAIYGNLLEEIIQTVNPFKETDPYTDFECIVLPMKFDDGMVNSAPNSFIRTPKIQLAATSRVNFATEDIKITLRSTPRRTLSVSAAEVVNPYVQVVGTMAAPRLAIDESGLLVSGGAAVATGGLSIVAKGLWDRLSQSRTPCKDAANAGIKELQDRLPDLAIEGLDRIQ